jgi:hypothetical protein
MKRVVFLYVRWKTIENLLMRLFSVEKTGTCLI